MDLSTIVTGFGSAGLGGGAAYVAKLVFDAWRAERTDDRLDRTTAVTDAATANATLVKTVETLQQENVRQAKKIELLEQEAEIKNRKIDDLEKRLNDIASELSDLKSGR